MREESVEKGQVQEGAVQEGQVPPEKVVHTSPMRVVTIEVPQLEGQASSEELITKIPLKGQVEPMEPELHEV